MIPAGYDFQTLLLAVQDIQHFSGCHHEGLGGEMLQVASYQIGIL